VRLELPDALDGERVDRVVAMLTGRSRSEVAGLVDAGAVRLDGTVVTTRSARVAGGGTLEVDLPDAPEGPVVEPDPDVPLTVVHVDDEVIVVDKPAGLVVHPGSGSREGTLVAGIVARYPEVAAVGEAGRPGIVHRLDRGTSGLLVVARTPLAHAALVAQLAARRVDRRYLALAWGTFASPRGVIDAAIGRSGRDPTRMAVSATGRDARTRYRVIERWPDPEVSLVECRLETGRTHQIRVHLLAIGHPVVGDARYRGARQSLVVGRPFLHAAELGFTHPASGEWLRFASPLPRDLQDVVEALGPSMPAE